MSGTKRKHETDCNRDSRAKERFEGSLKFEGSNRSPVGPPFLSQVLKFGFMVGLSRSPTGVAL